MGTHELLSLGGAGEGEWWRQEPLDPHHLYAAYVFDQAETQQKDIAAVIREARRLGHPVRYWWLSETMEVDLVNSGLGDRLIVCVHHPAGGENAGMDLYEALTQRGAKWDGLEAAAVEEYFYYSKTATGPNGIRTPDGRLIVSPPDAFAKSEHPDMREIDPLIAVTLGDAQAIALEELGRELTEAEIATMTADLQELVDGTVRRIVTDITHRERQQAAVTEGQFEKPGAPELSQYLVYYALSGLTLAEATSEQQANKVVFASLHNLLGRSRQQGVAPDETSNVRFHELEIDIGPVEAAEFPTEGL